MLPFHAATLNDATEFRNGAQLAIAEINARGGINGRPIEPVIYDPGSDNALFREYVRRMMTEQRVTTIFGCYTSSSRKAVP